MGLELRDVSYGKQQEILKQVFMVVLVVDTLQVSL